MSRLIIAAAIALAPLAALAQNDAGAVLRKASTAMGAESVKTIRYAGAGSATSFGQPYRAGQAWPRLNLPSYSRLVDYENAAFREDIARSRAEPTGGGAVPLTGEQKLSQYLRGSHAWNQAGPAPAPSLVAVPSRIHDLWITPHGVIKAAIKNNATVDFRTVSGKEVAVVSFTEKGAYSASIYFDDRYQVARVESRVPSPVLGDTATVTQYSEYRSFGNVKFPMRISQSMGGFPVLELVVTDVQPNAPADIQVPEIVRAAAERVAVEKAADGVWYLAGGSHHSVAIEMKDHMIVVESPLYDGRALPMLQEVKKLSSKPIRYVVNSHPHFDHAGGLRTAVGEGATIVVHEQAKGYFEKAFANPNRIAPDHLAKSGKKAKVMGVATRQVMNDGSRSVEIHAIQASVHAVPFLMVYLPKEKLLIEADAFTPGPPGSPAPTPVNANNQNLVDNIERLKLSVERILPLHGRIVPLQELYRVVGKTAP